MKPEYRLPNNRIKVQIHPQALLKQADRKLIIPGKSPRIKSADWDSKPGLRPSATRDMTEKFIISNLYDNY